ncbi:cytidylate kinase-like family protein [Patescibacteria group bacterium]|nr:cytidylate kinase-like family protein [Patescibacteria group bacterium]
MIRPVYQLIEKNLFEKIFPKEEKETKGALPIITISREMGSGGKPVANLVANRLGGKWKVYDQEIIDEIAREAHLEKQLVRSIDEKRLPLVDELVAEMFGRRYLNLSGYYKHLIKVLSLIGQRGYAIILGRGANFIFPHALKIRIICDMNQRITWLMTHEAVSRIMAVRKIENSDEERRMFVQTLFNHDHKKPHHYDITIRTGPNLTVEDASDIILELAKRRFKIRLP